MGCYNCQGPDGTEVTLCPTCRKQRSLQDLSISNAVNSGGGFRGIVHFIREEWLIVVGALVMLAASLNGVLWLFYGNQEAAIDAPWSTVNPAILYQSCIQSIQNPDVTEIDQDELIKGFQAEAAQFIQEHPELAQSKAELVRHVLQLRGTQSCKAAFDTCYQSPRSEACGAYVKAYK